jgi:2-polyprenyl-6-hydroxyphenyl methylase/3-demethylubiquinone-9 3-methyltransferase
MSWAESYKYDCEEVFGVPVNLGYALAYRNRREETLKLIAEALKPGAAILDMAAAQGNFTLALAERGYRVTWNDLRGELVEYVQKKYEYGKVSYAVGNAFELDFDEVFDGVMLCEVIEHMAHPDQFMINVARLLKPGGIAVMTTPNGLYFRNYLPRFSDCPDPSVFESVQFKPNSDGHIFLLWPDEVRRVAEQAGLQIEKQVFFTTPLTNGHMKTHVFLSALPQSWVWKVERTARRLPVLVQERLMVHTAARFRKAIAAP